MGLELIKNTDNLTLGAQRVKAVEEVYVGAEAPTEDKGYKVWVNPEETKLTELATKEYVDEAIKNVDISGYATTEYVDSAIEAIEIPEVDLSGYALKEDIPDVSAFKTEEEIIALIEEHGGGGEALPAAEESEF